MPRYSLGARESALKMHAYARWKMSKLKAVWCPSELTELVGCVLFAVVSLQYWCGASGFVHLLISVPRQVIESEFLSVFITEKSRIVGAQMSISIG